MKKNYINMIKDVMLNITSASLLTSVIQLLIFPFISRRVDINHFGVIIALYGFNNVIVNFLGNSLNNIRLIHDSEVKEKGNFTSLLKFSVVISFFLALILYFIYGSTLSAIELLISILFTLVSTLRAYLLVFFRLKIEYKKVLYTNFFIMIGYLLGLLLYNLLPVWSLIFLIGESFGIIYLFINTPFLKEGTKKDHNYIFLKQNYISLSSSNGIANALNYLDRFFINPILGSTNMSIYYSVNVVSKFVGMIITPFNNVVLSYINRMNSSNAKRSFINTNIVSAISLIPVYVLVNLISPYLIELLYPDFSIITTKYIWIVNLSTMFMLLSSIANPYIIKFSDLKYQFNIQIIYGLVYISLAFILSANFGLMGFCYATMVSFFIKWILVFFTGILKIK